MIYVDPLRQHFSTSSYWRGRKSCHMTANSLEELHSFAESVGLKRTWFQGGRHLHYDLTEGKRRLAIEKGAMEVSAKELLVKSKMLNPELSKRVHKLIRGEGTEESRRLTVAILKAFPSLIDNFTEAEQETLRTLIESKELK